MVKPLEENLSYPLAHPGSNTVIDFCWTDYMGLLNPSFKCGLPVMPNVNQSGKYILILPSLLHSFVYHQGIGTRLLCNLLTFKLLNINFFIFYLLQPSVPLVCNSWIQTKLQKWLKYWKKSNPNVPAVTDFNGGETEVLQKVIFDGDQLTEERARNCQWANSLGRTQIERLEGVTPAFADWHLKKCS